MLGICNGFQVLCEAGLLPGALMRNARPQVHLRPVRLRVEGVDTPFYLRCIPPRPGAHIPIAHGEG
ncbi:MAG: phosphoribosylformylglycinamidine synthase subunit PurQ [Gemmatimonadaceae bacterium]|nr:phosphoribosylformylglycinamidine synthase subunit PurQ [Gemmatimonadaceae bacterium]